MVNIDKDSFTVGDVEEYIKLKSSNFQTNKKLEVVNVNSTSFNNGTSRDYPFCMPIKHPETGETLRPVKGYMGLNEKGDDRCYYAEYQDKKGTTYSYTFKFEEYNEDLKKFFPKKSIREQQAEDLKTLEQSLQNAGGLGLQ